MTNHDILQAIFYMKNEIQCVRSNDTCNHDCKNCDLVVETEPLLEAYDMAIQALLFMQKLPKIISNIENTGKIIRKTATSKQEEYYCDGYDRCLTILKKKLSENDILPETKNKNRKEINNE